MKFKCGLTVEEKKQAELDAIEDFKNSVIRGKRKFAWWPVTIKPGRCVWLEYYLIFPDVDYDAEADHRKETRLYALYSGVIPDYKYDPWPERYRIWNKHHRDRKYIYKEIV